MALAQGEYQQTKDGKTTIWNGTPRSGETATWNADRDKDDYATGFGALTWYTAKGKVYALYYGNMVRGKFEGAVNVHTNGRTAHAYFVDGGRVTAWVRGSAPSKMALPEEALIQKRKMEAETAAVKEEERVEVATKPTPAPPKTESEKVRSTEHIAGKPAATPPEPTPPMVAEKQTEPAATAKDERPFEEPAAISTPAEERQTSEPAQSQNTEPPFPKDEQTVPQSASREEQPVISHSPTPERATSATKSERDVSLSTLAGPPASLRTTTSPPKSDNESAPPERIGALTETEAINLADTEARIHGYPLDNYQRPKVDHSNVKGKWSLFYGLKDPAAKSAETGPFTVTVEDKTRKAEIRK